MEKKIAPNLGTIMLNLLGEGATLTVAGLAALGCLILERSAEKADETGSIVYKKVKENCSPM